MISRLRFPLLCAVTLLVSVGVSLRVSDAPGAPSETSEHLRGTDRSLCSFPVTVSVERAFRTEGAGSARVEVRGPTTVNLRNTRTGKSIVLEANGRSTTNTTTLTTTFTGKWLWLSTATHLPYLETRGMLRQTAPSFRLSPGTSTAQVVDPCALLSSPTFRPTSFRGRPPWPAPAFTLSLIDTAGLVPVVAPLVRHDHVHLDIVIDGRPVVVPATLGQADPSDAGVVRCPPPPERDTIGDCTAGHFFAPHVAISPLHTHTASGILHVESDREAAFTLGQVFDEWGVRFDRTCLGAACSGAGKTLAVVVNGARQHGDPRTLVLRNHQEIAIVFGTPKDISAAPRNYPLRWPDGCGGKGESPCLQPN